MKTARDRILAAARGEFAASGYIGASTNRIVSVAGVSKGLLFAHFGTKEDLYLTVLMGELERFVRAVAARPLEGRDPVDRFVETIGAVFAYYNRHRTKFAVMMSAAELGRPLQEKLLKRLADAALPDLIGRVVEGVEDGNLLFSPSEMGRVLALVLNGIKQTISVGIRARTSVSALERVFRSELELAVRVLRQGIYKGGAT